MREMLFRGKRIDNGEWVEGDLAHSYLKVEDNCIINKCGYHQVIPETVGQFTGLTDKNGKKIFEGDIVKDAHHTGVVSFGEFNCSCCEGVYGWSFSNGADIRYHSIHEVIGNTHDNPELLGGD